MKIKKTTKKIGAVHPELDVLLQQLLSVPEPSLASKITHLVPHNTPWQYPRGDLNHWAAVLDRLDEILERVIAEYKVDEAQVEEFKQGDKELVLEILRLEKLVIDNSTSRKHFASYDRLQALLASSDLDIVQADLSLLLRPAQAYSYSTSFELNEKDAVKNRLLKLAMAGGTWRKLKEYGWGMTRLAKLVNMPKVDGDGDMAMEQDTEIGLPDSFFDVTAQFYRPLSDMPKMGSGGDGTDTPDTRELVQPTAELRLGSQESTPVSTQQPHQASSSAIPPVTPSRPSALARPSKGRVATLMDEDVTSTPQTPPRAETQITIRSVTTSSFSRASTNSDGLTTLTISPSALADMAKNRTKSPTAIMGELLASHPELAGESMAGERFELLSRLRCVMMMGSADGKADVKLQEEVEKMLNIRLTALATYSHLVTENVAQTNLFLYEPTLIGQVADLVQPQSNIDESIIASAFWALDAFAHHRNKTGEVLTSVNASVAHGTLMNHFRGLVKRLSNDEDVPHPLMDATLTFISFAASTQTYSHMLVGAGIIPTLVDLIKTTNEDRASYVSRSIGLLDNVIYANPNAFGIFSGANGVDVLNERVSVELDRHLSNPRPENDTVSELTRRTTPLKLMLRSIHRLMQSGGTIDALRNLIDSQLPKSLLRILQNANALGAPVLALAINITATFVHNEPTSLAVIQDLELPQALYDAVEANEHPSFDVISTVPYAVSALCLNQAGLDYALGRPGIMRLLVNLPRNPLYRDMLRERDNATYLGSSLDELVRHHPALKPSLLEALSDSLREIAAVGQAGRFANITKKADYQLVIDRSAAEGSEQQDVEMQDLHDKDGNAIEGQMDLVIQISSQMMHGLFHNPQFAKDFLAQGGMQLVLNLYELPCLVSQFSTTETAAHLINVFRSLAEGNLAKVLSGVLDAVKIAMAQVSSFWRRDEQDDKSVALDLMRPKDDIELQAANTQFRNLVYLNNLLGLMSNLYVSVGYNHAKVATTLLQSLGSMISSSFLSNLGKLHRACLYENIQLKPEDNASGNDPAAKDKPRTMEDEIMSPMVETPSIATSLLGEPVLPEQETPVQSTSGTEAPAIPVKPSDNYVSVKYIITRIPHALLPFFQSVIKSLVLRRPEATHRLHSQPTADQIATVLTDHLESRAADLSATGHLYHSSMVGLVSVLLFDDRMTKGSLQTMLLIAFQKRNGMIILRGIAEQQVACIEQVSSSTPSDRTNQLRRAAINAIGGFKMAIELIKSLVSSQAMFESNQTLTLATKDKEPDSEDYFSPVAFLNKARIDFAPIITQVFYKTWLSSVPLSIIQPAVKAMLSLLEEPQAIPSATGGMGFTAFGTPLVTSRATSPNLNTLLVNMGWNAPPGSVTASTTDFQVDQRYLDFLVDIGFTTYAATRALTRMRNHVLAATEFLMEHGETIVEPREASATAAVPTPQPAPVTPAVPITPAAEATAVETAPTESSSVDASTSTPMEGVKATSPPKKDVVQAVFEGRRQLLEKIRERHLKKLPKSAIDLVERHDELVFALAPALMQTATGPSTLVDTIVAMVKADPLADAKLRGCLRLFAVMAHQAGFTSKLDTPKCEELMAALNGLPSQVASPRPIWLSVRMLSVDSLLIWGESLQKPSGESLPSSITTGPVYAESREHTLSYAVDLLQQTDLNEDELLAILRTLVFLTRDRAMAAAFIAKEGPRHLFDAVLRAPAKRRSAATAFATIIIRHLVEDDKLLATCIQKEIKSWFAKPRAANITVNHFVSNLKSAALRAPHAFLKAAEQECELATAEAKGGQYTITAKSAGSQKLAEETVEQAQQEKPKEDEMQVDDPFGASITADTGDTASKPLGQVMQYLGTELLSLAKQSSARQETAGASSADAAEQTAPSSLEPQLSVVLLLLVELLGSYTESKMILLKPSRKSGKEVLGHSKTKSPVLNALLNNFVCNLLFDADVNRASGEKVSDAARERMNVSNWASAVVVALCSDSDGSTDIKSSSSVIVAVRKTVMDAILKSIKEVGSSNEPLGVRYGKLWALSDLCYRLLTARSVLPSKQHDDSALHIAKIMLEKGFVVTLTNAMADIDLGYPNIKNLITAIVQPLEYLTKIAMKMARPEKSKAADISASDEDSLDESDEDDDVSMDEEEAVDDSAPDMYRNSSLGMYGGEMEEDSGDEDDMDDEDDDGDLEGYEEVEEMDDDDSQGTEPTDESESEDEDELEQWDGTDDEEDQHDDRYATPAGHNAGLVVDGDEPFVQEVPAFATNDGGPAMEMEMEDEVYDMEEDYGDEDMEDEQGSESDYDEEEELDALDTVVVDPLTAGAGGGPTLNWGWGQPVRTQNREDSASRNRQGSRGMAARYDHLLDEDATAAMFGQPRAQDPGSASIASHPLLQQQVEQPPQNTATGSRSRGLRAGMGGMGGIHDLVHSLDRLMGGDAINVFEQLLDRAQGAGDRPELIQIRYGADPTGATRSTLDIEVGGHRSSANPRRSRETSGGQTLPESEPAVAVPLPTISRWQEEEKIFGPYDSTGRVNTIGAWLSHILLPAAKAADEIRKKKAAEEAEKRRVAEEEKQKKAEEERLRKEAEEAEQKAQAAAEKAAQEANAPAEQDVEMAEPTEPAEAATAAPAEPRARVTFTIGGTEVDITDTGIDPEFLSALPEEMQAEVLQQHMRESRATQARPQPSGSTEISREFLDALPAEIRAEVIEQEAIEAARRNNANRRQAAGGEQNGQAAGEGAFGNAGDLQAFLATLDPALRQVVLLEQDEDLLATLPPHLTTGVLGLPIVGGDPRHRQRVAQRIRTAGAGVPGEDTQNAASRKAPAREVIQLLDKSSLAALIRLLFFPDLHRKTNLLRVVANLCENSKSRADVINLLLGVLQDDAGDLSTVDKQSANRTGGRGQLTTPKSVPRKKTGPDSPNSQNMLAQLQSDTIPSFIAQRAFDSLSHIASTNEQAVLYFLTEQDLPSFASRGASRKGKGKERSLTYPLVILMKLLDRQSLLSTPNMSETLTTLLATLTKPLSQLTASNERKAEATPAEEPPVAQPVEGTQPAPIASPTGETSQTPVAVAVAAAEGTQGDAVATPAAPSDAPATVVPAKEGAVDEAAPPANTLKNPPQIPDDVLKLVPSVLSQGECSSRTFSSTLNLIQNLGHIPNAKQVITAQLQDQAQRLSDALHTDLQALQSDLQAVNDNPSGKGISLSAFSPASSAQAKLLRILKTLDYMYSTRDLAAATSVAANITSVADGSKPLTPQEEEVERIFEALHFTPLWDALSRCLALAENQEALSDTPTVLLPLVEALMVVSKYGSARASAERKRAGSVPFSPMSPREGVEEDSFVKFTTRHRTVLNTLVRNNPSLMSGSFALLVLNPRVLEFENKRTWFMQQLRKRTNRDAGGPIHLNVRRTHVFEDSYRNLQSWTNDNLKYGKLSVKFSNEEGIDAGGVTREWYAVLAQSIFNPGYCLFEPCAADQLTYQPSQHSWVNGEHLGYFKFIGRIIGKAIYDGRLLDAYFSRAFYKQILGRKVDVRDLESVDPEYHKSLVWMLENDITGVIDLDFSLEADEFGAKQIIDLKPDGSNIPVTEQNKEEYVQLVVKHRLEASIKEQVKSFLDGFYEIVPRDLVAVFDPDQLELLISGISNIDVDELKNATQLHGWKQGDAEITWFWRALRSFSQEERAKFLMFVTSSSRVPLGGFTQLQGSGGVQPFQIHKLYREDVLPSAATCFNELLLPSYPSYEALRSRLLTAINEGAQYFGNA